MPVLAINTNMPDSSVPDGFVKAASELVAKLTGKPESYVMIYVNAGLKGCFAGKSDPFIFAELQSIGGFSSANKVAEAVTELFTKQLGVQGARVYFKMVDPDPKFFAHNGRTFVRGE